MVELSAGPAGDQFDAMAAGMFGYLRDLQRHGDAVAVDLAGVSTAVLYDLDAIYKVLADKLEHVGMAPVFERLSHATGSGILTNYHWQTWHPRRRRIVKPLGARSVGQFRQRMVAIIDEELDSWPVGEDFDLYPAVRRLTLRVVADLLFSTDLTEEAVAVIDRAVEEIHAWAESDPANADLANEPESFRSAIADLHAVIDTVIATRDRENPGEDMIGVLVAAAAEPDPPLDGGGVRDEAVTLILAGHETVTNTISFAVDLLGRNPAACACQPRHIVDETLRLYPPVHVTNRAIVADFDVGGLTLPAGWEVLIPEYVVYRDDRHFERAAEFLPDRWNDHSRLRLDRRAYFPFLTGPKFCVGSHFALLEATETMNRFLARFDHKMLDPEPPWGREFALSFAPDRPLPCRLARR